MIVTKGLTKKFEDFLAVDGVDLSVGAGEVLALLGPNGAGKTTTVRMLTSILRPTSGTAQVAGFDVAKDAQKVRASVGVLTENHGLYARMPAFEYLDFYGQLYAMEVDQRKQRVTELLEQFGLAEDQHRRIGEYSKGMRQKLALARALLHNPLVLLLDEPTSAMDPESARLVRDSIKELRSAERTIIICTHNLAEAEELADQIAIIRRGKIIAKGSPLALKQTLLGAGEFEIQLASTLNGSPTSLPPGVTVSAQGNKWIRFRTSSPEEDNPNMLRAMLEQGYPVISLQEVPRSLEQVYLEAVNAPDGEEVLDVA
ncbi:MAG: ABC transporter ATP-binding protein [Anaerolineales bacterium]|nr:ABC transporter ATP-binding protein [Chloroflexota bacterium]MBL6981327.1 ABC transporter ATP-binding protein [Anaerolineales bacterium]